MSKKRAIGSVSILWLAFLPLWGGTGSPSDGLLSFILLFGFLLFLLGILQLASYVKRKFREILGEIY